MISFWTSYRSLPISCQVPSLRSPPVAPIPGQLNHVLGGLLRVLLVQHHRQQDPALSAFGREEEAVAVVDAVRLDLVDVLDEMSGLP